MEPSHEELDPGRRWFDWYIQQHVYNSVRLPAEGGPYCCPCCGFQTLDERGDCDICPICFWEDDGQDRHHAEVVRGGPNGGLSLTLARQNYLLFGACEEKMRAHVRPPLPEEYPANQDT